MVQVEYGRTGASKVEVTQYYTPKTTTEEKHLREVARRSFSKKVHLRMNDEGPFVMVTEIVDPRIHGELKNLMKDAEFADNQPDIMGVSFFIHV